MKKNALLFILLSLIPSGLHPAFEFRYYGFRNSAQGEIVSCLDKTLPPASPADAGGCRVPGARGVGRHLEDYHAGTIR